MIPTERRNFLKRVFAGFGGLSLAHILQLRAQAANPRDTSLILLWQDGGASPFETFDPKPEAPREYRGEFGSTPTSLPGVHFCELLPRLSRMAHKFSIIRSLHQKSSAHVSGTHTVITGYDRTGVISGPPSHPDLGAIIHRTRSRPGDTLPGYVALSQGLHRGGTSYLGKLYSPFGAPGDPNAADFRVESLKLNSMLSNERLSVRRSLLEDLDGLRRDVDGSGLMAAVDRYQERAYSLLTSPAASRAFDLRLEDDRVRDRYGRHTAGQQALLARRLVEAGVGVVAVRFSPDGRGDNDKSFIGWDDHPVHGNIFEIMKRRLPQFDQALSTLIEDIESRGLERDVLVVVAGEFGRTPRISHVDGHPGRDHWGPAGCALVYGGGLRMGQVIGATNRRGEHPVERALRPQDLLATVYHTLGVDPHHEFSDLHGRPFPILPYGKPIAELV